QAADRRPGDDPGAAAERTAGGQSGLELARRQVDAGDLPGLDAERGVEVLAGGARADAQDVRLVGDAEVANLTRDHLQARLGPQEPAADLFNAAERAGVVAHMDAHLDALVHQRHRAGPIPVIELLEEVFHRVDCAHRGRVYERAQPRAARLPRRRASMSDPSSSTITWAGRGRPL